MNELPNFIYVGFGKCGSTWLHRMLSEHEEVFMTPVKETNYFDLNYHRGRDWYASFFEGADGFTARGEISHRYARDPNVAQRIKDTLGTDVRIIAFVREPVDWFLSGYIFTQRNGMFQGSQDEFLDQCLQKDPTYFSFGDLLAPYRETFDNVLVAPFDHIKSQPQQLMDALCDHLGTRRLELTEEMRKPVNQAAQSRFPVLARMATRISKQAKRMGLQRLIAAAKDHKQINRVLYTKLKNKPSISEVVQERVREIAAENVRVLDERFGLGLRSLWSYE